MYIYPTKLVPRASNEVLRALALGRVSKAKATDNQTQEDLQSSFAAVRHVLCGIYDGPMDLTELGEQESGLIADRSTVLEAMEMIASGNIDLVISEDLSKIFRNPRFQWIFVQDAVDMETRVILFGDNIDTADPDWEIQMGVATLRHGLYIPDARRRVRRTATFSFHRGGQVQKVKYGYRKLSYEDAQSGKYGPVGLRVAKVQEATEVIKKMREILMTQVNGQYSYVPLLNYLRHENIPTGPYVSSDDWSQRIAKDLLTDPILIGGRRFRKILFDRVHSTGRFRRRPNPDGPETEHYSELAHLTDDEFATMQEVIQEIAAQHRCRTGAEHPLYRNRRKDAVFPRQHATCSVCEGLMYAYGSDGIKCENAHKHGENRCWNHVQVDMKIAQEKFVPWLMSQIGSATGVRNVLVDYAMEELASLRATLQQGSSGRRRTITQLEREAENIAKAIRKGGKLDSFVKEAADIEEQLRKLRELELQSEVGEDVLPVCRSREEVDQQLDQVLLYLAETSYEFANLMREIIPQFEIIPVQAIDSGLVRPRARITLSVDRLCSGSVDGLLVPDMHVELDLFDPPKHIRHVDACLEIKHDGPSLSYIKIAEAINERLALQVKKGEDPETISYMTVKRCFAIARQMEAEGLSEPYRVLTETPECASRWKPRSKKTREVA